jgi:hypothetical protein
MIKKGKKAGRSPFYRGAKSCASIKGVGLPLGSAGQPRCRTAPMPVGGVGRQCALAHLAVHLTPGRGTYAVFVFLIAISAGPEVEGF